VVIDDLLNPTVMVGDDEMWSEGSDGLDICEEHRRLLSELPAQACDEEAHVIAEGSRNRRACES
jgi:hypothetical protein